MDLTNSERETHLNQCADDRSCWEMYTDDPVMIRKMAEIEIQPFRTSDVGAWYKLDKGNLTLRKKRVLSKSVRKQYSDRMREIRASQTN